jgi:hypothetical protein
MIMAYERYGTRDFPRDERSRWQGENFEDRRRGRDERGFFERAGDEVASWFGDEEAERRRREDQMRQERERGTGRDWRGEEYRGGYFPRGEERGRFTSTGRDWDRSHPERDEDRFSSSRWRDRDPSARSGERDFERERERSYRPVTGDYGRGSEQFFAASGIGREDFDRGHSWREREPRDEDFRRSGFAGAADRSREYDPHYHSWRQRHMSELDRDYDEYRRERQSRFESDFGSWRERRMQKRALLGQIREHMEVVGSDEQHVGTIDRVAGDRIILTKSDPESGGVHHSLSCSEIDRVEGDRVILDLNAEQAKQRWRDESRERALFEREDQGEMGPQSLNRSFEGTYR